MESKKSHDLPSAGWGTRKAGGIIQFKWKAGQRGQPTSEGRRSRGLSSRRKAASLLLHLFAFFKSQGIGWRPPALEGWSLLSPANAHLFGKHPTLPDTPRSNVLPAIWASLSPVKVTCKINHHNFFIYEEFKTSLWLLVNFFRFWYRWVSFFIFIF